MAAPTIRFLFDFLSPYAYLAWTQIHEVADRVGAAVTPVPVLFPAILNAHGQKGPAEIPPKRIYVFKDVLRRAYRLGVPLVPPPTHPFNPLLPLRVASLPLPAAARRRLIDGLWAATWGGGDGIDTPDKVTAVASAAGLDGAAAVSDAEAPDGKARLRQQTDDAIAAGAFGVPTMIVGEELFWGVDALPHLEAYVRGEDPVARLGAEQLARWAAIAPSATR